MKLYIRSTGVYQGPAYMINTEDGPQGVFDSFAGVTTMDGKEWRHHQPFGSPRDYRLLQLVDTIGQRGFINTDHWVELEPATSLEDRLTMAVHGFRSTFKSFILDNKRQTST